MENEQQENGENQGRAHSKNPVHSLKVNDLCKYYSRTLLFKDVSFSLEKGEVLAITGWNGSGKSTLLRIIAGLVRPSAGHVDMLIEDRVVPKESRRRFLGMVAPALSLYDELTGLENIAFFCRVRGVPYDSQDCLKTLDRVGLADQGDKVCRNYSSGMKQRLKIVQALIHDPPLLLLDEPGSNLDSKGIKVVEEIIANQRNAGMTVIASNEKREVDYADRIINLSE
jgi:heme exporter protein A